MRARRNLALLVIFSLLLVLFQAQFPTVQTSSVIKVPQQYPTIQEAVNKAAPGDIIEVSADVYYENLEVTKSLTLKGQDKSNTIIDGNGTYNVVNLIASGVAISGFTIRNGGIYIGIQIDTSGGHKIMDNIISNNVYGIDLFEATSGNTIVGNTILKNSMIGINVAYSSSNNISKNHISESTYGIKLEGTSQYNSIAENTILETSYGIHVGYSPNNNIDRNNVSSKVSGIYSVYSDYTNIRNNTVSGCAYGIDSYQSNRGTISGNTVSDTGYGIYLVYSTTNTLDSNLASNNDWAINLYDSDTNTIIQNTASYNTYGILLISYSTGNVIAWNNIMYNTMQKYQDTTSGTNTWYKASGGKRYGNYWSDYMGEDTDKDGVGNTLTPHAGVDSYPLMNPWSTVHDVAIINVMPSQSSVYQGQVVNITVVARNEGTTKETFNVTAKYFNRVIGTKTVTNLTRYASATLVFNWNTAGVPTGFNYEISAEASKVAGETDLVDNIFVDGTITVEKPPTPPTTLSVFPASIIGPPPNIAETFVVNITVSDVSDLWGWRVGMTFNPNVLEAVNFTEGPFLKTGGTTIWQPATINNTLGIIEPHRCTLTSGSTPVSGNGTLSSITFRVKNYGSSTLHLGPDPPEINVVLIDPTMTPIQATLKDGYFKLPWPPVASFTFSPLTPYTKETVTFNATTSYDPDGYIVKYLWNFGDGTNATGKITTHSFADDGTYRVVLTVTDSDGLTNTTSSDIIVRNRPPVAIFTESAETVPTGELIYFNASRSYDPDGTILSYFWNFGDGTNSTGVIVNHAYTDNGSYTVTLTVTDDDGAISSTSSTKTILNRPPVAVFTESAETVNTGETIRFNATRSYDPDGNIVTYFWDFGDGTNATGVTVNHAYADDGAYIVTLTVTDDDDASASTSAAKTVLNRSPIASFTESATTVLTGEVIHFNASSSYDADGAIVSYFWDFGDGTNGAGVTVDHAYVDDGTYTVILIVTDDDDASNSTSATKTVSNRPPVADFTYSPSYPFLNEPVTFNASTSYDPDGYIGSYFWDFGDETNATSKVVIHTYAKAGTYKVALTVTDDDGVKGTTTATVTVSYFVRDVAVVDVVLSATEAYLTWTVPLNITVIVKNQGEKTETFTVTVYYNTTGIGTQTVTLAQGANTTLIFRWNLFGVAEGTYTIRAEASVLFSETDIVDNSLIDGTVKLKHPGDANDDGIVNVYDLNILAKALGTSVGDPSYDRRADFNGDGVIDDYDVEILQLYWGP